MEDEYKNTTVEAEVEAADLDDEAEFEALAPDGKYSAVKLNLLVAATNKLLPLFEQEPTYPTFAEDLTGKLPTDFIRVLSMFQGAVAAAVANDDIEEELAFDLQELIDDPSLLLLAGRLTSLANNKSFKKYLANPVEEEVEEDQALPISKEEALMSNQEIDTLFAQRA